MDDHEQNVALADASPRLLVIDDDLVQRTIIARLGAQAGYETHVAASIEGAIGQIGTFQFDCVTLDLSLGDQSGTRLLDMIAGSGTRSVIVVSGCDERLLNAAAQLVRTVGLTAHQVPKPLDLKQLRRLLTISHIAEAPAVRKARTEAAIGADAVRDAIARAEIVPWFQPKIDLSSGRISGCEALARWPHPQLGMIPPDVFIPIVETSGLMPTLTQSLLCAATKAVRDIVRIEPGFSTAVNVSASLLRDRSVADYVARSLEESGIPPGALVLEVTESVAMSDVARAADILVELRVKGVGLSIDDFGTGYSSLAALARMPFNELKIDGTLIRESDVNPDMMRVVRATIKLGHELGMSVVAEGIETRQTLARLQRAGCDVGQGLVFMPAVEASVLKNYVQRFISGGAGLPLTHVEGGLAQAC